MGLVERALELTLAHCRRVQDQTSGLFVHYCDLDAASAHGEAAPAWGRGNGWAVLGLSDLLTLVPATHPVGAELGERLRTALDALRPLQTPDGWWRNVVDDPASYPEASTTAMLATAIAQAVEAAVAETGLLTMADDAWRAVEHRIDTSGQLVGVSYRPGVNDDPRRYGGWGYSELVVSLANTGEPLYLAVHGANRPSHEGVVDLYDRSIALCRQAGFADVLLRGDTDFSLTAQFDRWDGQGVRLVFGYDAKANLVKQAQGTEQELYHELTRRADHQIATPARTRPANVKDAVVRQRGYKTLRQKNEDVCEFSYRPGKCAKDYPSGRAAQEPLGRARRERALR